MKTNRIVLLFTVVLFCTVPALAQTASTGALTGEISDPHGAVVAGAQVLVVNEATGEKPRARSA